MTHILTALFWTIVVSVTFAGVIGWHIVWLDRVFDEKQPVWLNWAMLLGPYVILLFLGIYGSMLATASAEVVR
jgi:hypothetical protein